MKLQSSYTPAQCREALQTALARQVPLGEVRGYARGNLFRLSILEKRSFGRRNGVSYTLYGRICEGADGRAEISCFRFLGFFDPLKILAVYAAVLLVLLTQLPQYSILRIAGAALASCAAVIMIGTLGMYARLGPSQVLRDKLDAFLRETLETEGGVI